MPKKSVVEDPKATVEKVEEPKESVELSAESPKETLVEVECRGITPLLMSAMSQDEIVNTLIRRQRAPVQTDLSLEKMAEKRLYQENGQIGIPAVTLFSCLRDAGRFVKFDARRSISTREETLLPSILRINETFLPLQGSQKWIVDVRRGRMKDGTAVGIVRPRFNDWGFRVTLSVNLTPPVTEKTIRRLVEVAGRRCGLLSFRPSLNGIFGQFEIAEWKVTETN